MPSKYSPSSSKTESSDNDEKAKLLMDAHVEPQRSDVGVGPGKKRRLVHLVGGYGATDSMSGSSQAVNATNRDDTDNLDGVLRPNDQEQYEDEEEGLKYGAQHVIKLLATINSINFYSTKDVYLLYTPFHEQSSDTGTEIWNALANSMISMVVIVLIVLYKI